MWAWTQTNTLNTNGDVMTKFKIGDLLTHNSSHNKKEILVYLGKDRAFLLRNHRGFYDGNIYNIHLDNYVRFC